MPTKKVDFAMVLQKCESVVKDLGLVINYTQNFDPFFKGDLDGKTIIIGSHLSAEEKVFNLLHLAGHSIQWNISELLRTLGSELYKNPDDELLKKLQTYEWQANCYALSVLHKAGIRNLDKWLSRKYIIDMLYLTHFYKTGEKLKQITAAAKAYPFNRELESKEIPAFTPTAGPRTRNGIVIAF
jgi:hypothetical protein